jgi:CheY-like chemotaxis protein
LKGKILVADDEPDTLNLVKMILEDDGYEVILAINGEEAVAKANAEQPHLIFLDVVMPGKSGFEVCKVLKSQQKTKFTPIITFSALGREADKKLSREAGAEDHFVKPFTPEDLINEVQSYLKKAEAEKFSKSLNISHTELRGRKILLEFDPTSSYEKIIRDFALEARSHGEAVIILSPETSVIYQSLKDEENMEFASLSAQTIMSPILEAHPEKPVSLVFDNLTDLILSMGFQPAYNFTKNTLARLSDPKETAVFLLNSKAHVQNESYSIRALLSNQLTYGEDGLKIVKLS